MERMSLKLLTLQAPNRNDRHRVKAFRVRQSLRRLATLGLLGCLLSAGGASVAVAQSEELDALAAPVVETQSLVPSADEPKMPLPDQDQDSLRSELENSDSPGTFDDSVPEEEVGSQISSKSVFQGRQAEVSGGRFALPPIAALTTSQAEIGTGEVPQGFRRGDTAPHIALPESATDRGLPAEWHLSYWAAANAFSHPLYFEDRMLERHGHQRFPHLTPLVSGARFAAQASILPYLSAIHPPYECQYTLGYYRAGNCVPALKQRPPYKRQAVAAQAASMAVWMTIWP